MTDERLASKRAAKAEAKTTATKGRAKQGQAGRPRGKAGRPPVRDHRRGGGCGRYESERQALEVPRELAPRLLPRDRTSVEDAGRRHGTHRPEDLHRGIAAPCCGLLVNKVTGLPFLRMQRGSFTATDGCPGRTKSLAHARATLRGPDRAPTCFSITSKATRPANVLGTNSMRVARCRSSREKSRRATTARSLSATRTPRRRKLSSPLTTTTRSSFSRSMRTQINEP